MSANVDNSDDASINESKIIQQIEYYFGDINLIRDKFLKEVTQKNDGWVPIDVLLTFNRLKSLTTDTAVVVNSLKKSSSGLLDISECETKIRRRTEKPLPELTDEYKTTLLERTVHAKGFPTIDTKLDDVMTFFKQFGSIESIEMRRTLKQKTFKGCVFVVFSAKEDAEKFINSDDVKYNDSPLLRENKVQYYERKKTYHEARKNQSKSRNGSRDSSRSRCDNDSIKADDDNEEENDKSDAASGSQSTNPVKFEGAVLKLKGVNKKTAYFDIKKAFMQHGKVEYVENVNEELESFIRFGEKDGAKIALEKAKIVSNGDGDIKVEIAGNDVVAEVLSGEEEVQYWLNYQNRLKGVANRDRSTSKRGRRGKNMWQRGNKRKSFSGYGGSKPKHTKFDCDQLESIEPLRSTSQQQINVNVEPKSEKTGSESINIKLESDQSNQIKVEIKAQNE